jgi:hypothetical protein
MEAALQNPHAIVQFSTDGIVSLAPLDLPIGDRLGQWEADELICDELGRGALYAFSGVYTNYSESEGKDTTKTRGMSPGNMVRSEGMTLRDLLLDKFLPAWQMPCDPADPATWPRVEFEQREFVTAGSAVTSPARFKLIGRWAIKARNIDAHSAGLKRRLWAGKQSELYLSTETRSLP